MRRVRWAVLILFGIACGGVTVANQVRLRELSEARIRRTETMLVEIVHPQSNQARSVTVQTEYILDANGNFDAAATWARHNAAVAVVQAG